MLIRYAHNHSKHTERKICSLRSTSAYIEIKLMLERVIKPMFVRSLETRYVDMLERFVFLQLNLMWRFDHILRTSIVYIYQLKLIARWRSITVCYTLKMYLWSYRIYDKTIENILQKCNVNTRENNELDNAAT